MNKDTEHEPEKPPFTPPRLTRSTVSGLLPRSAFVIAAAVLLVVAIPALALRSAPVPGNPQPSPTVAIQSATPVALPPGQASLSVTPCAEVRMPSYVPRASGVTVRDECDASSEDTVALMLPDLTIVGSPAVLTITSQTASSGALHGSSPRPTQAAGRDLVVSAITGPGMQTAPPNARASFVVRTQAIAQWTEPAAACPNFTAVLWSPSTDAEALRSELVKIVASIPPAPHAAPAWVPVVFSSEADAWARIRAEFQTGPVAMPTWLPPQVDRSRVELRRLSISPTREYEVVYRDTTGNALLTFGLGPAVITVGGSGVGFCCVRGSRATLAFDSALYNDPSKPGLRDLRWTEQQRTLSIRSERISGDDLMHIGFALDHATAPRNPYPDARTNVGACSSTASPAETVTRLLALSGSGDRASVLDCYALDAIIAQGTDGFAIWATLPGAANAKMVGTSPIAGQTWVTATWDFTSDPDGAWGPHPMRVFLVGLDDGRWRIYESDTAAFAPPP
jgi:hypothetical protein